MVTLSLAYVVLPILFAFIIFASKFCLEILFTVLIGRITAILLYDDNRDETLQMRLLRQSIPFFEVRRLSNYVCSNPWY